MRRALPFLALLGAVLAAPLSARQPAASDAEARKELKELREDAVDALNKKDLDRLLKHVHPDAVLTAPHADPGKEVSRGKDGVRAYFEKMFSGPDRRAESVTAEVTVDDRIILPGGDRAVAWGSSRDTYRMRDGSDFVMLTRWSGTLVREGGRWLILEFHVSANPFDNPIQSAINRNVALWSGGIAAAVALVVGLLVGLVLGRRGQQPPELRQTKV
jgi:ketosteroid isomerase-like protein